MDDRSDFLSPLKVLANSIARSVGEWAKKNPSQAEVVQWLLEEASTPPHGGETLGAFFERVFRNLYPPNWWDLSLGAQAAARRTMLDTGLCLAWAPRAEVVSAIVSAKSKTDHDAVLVLHEDLILTDLEAVAGEATHERLDEPRVAAIEAISAYRSGHCRAAQALAASAIVALLAEHYAAPKFAQARKVLTAEHPERVGLRRWRPVLIQWALGAAIETTYTEPRPEGFNRHVTAHSVASHQYTRAHALAAMLLLVGTLRELHEHYAQMAINPQAPRLGPARQLSDSPAG